ncbi:MAG: hypothetical protein AB1486_12880 [Planctomycetota bacterium]
MQSYQVFEMFACPEVVGLDDKGRCVVLASYSGTWTPYEAVFDVRWLGGLAQADVDPRIEGKEIYTGGQRGNLYQIVSYPFGALDCRLIGHLQGMEIHTILAGELDPATRGSEVLVFTNPGALYRFTPTGPNGTFVHDLVRELEGRVRDALVLPSTDVAAPEIPTVSRAGRLELLRFTPAGPVSTTVHEAPMGMGRIALRPPRPQRATVLYTTLDDGCVMRHERLDANRWTSEAIFLGPQGPRGLAAGQFNEDEEVETVAVFGYSKKVQLLTRHPEGWSLETIFEDRDKGHWLAAAELDGRNATQELLASGYGGRIVLLSRPPGYGMKALRE